MSCCVGSMRWKMLRRLISMVSRLSGGPEDIRPAPVRARDWRRRRAAARCVAGARLLRHGERQRAAGRQLEPFIGDDQHRLREIERGEGRIDRQRDDAVGQRDLVVLEPVALAPEHHADRLAGRDLRRHQRGRRLRRYHRLGLVVRPRRGGEHEGAVGDRGLERVEQLGLVEHAVGAGGRDPGACGFGQPSRGLTRRSRDRPKFAMARAAAPIFSPSCGSTRITTGAGASIQRLVLSVPAPGMQCSSAGKCPVGAAPAQTGRLRQAAVPLSALAGRRLSRTDQQGFYQRSADAIGRAPNSRQSDSRLAMSAPRTIHLRARGKSHSRAPVNGQFPVGPNKHGDQRCKHAKSRNHVDKGR